MSTMTTSCCPDLLALIKAEVNRRRTKGQVFSYAAVVHCVLRKYPDLAASHSLPDRSRHVTRPRGRRTAARAAGPLPAGGGDGPKWPAGSLGGVGGVPRRPRPLRLTGEPRSRRARPSVKQRAWRPGVVLPRAC